MKELSYPDNHHLKAAVGWLELGNHLEANAELDRITPELRAHPDVLELRWEIYSREKKWEACADIADAIMTATPDRAFGWLHYSFAKHELKQTQDAYENLVVVVDDFPKEWQFPYNLACYCAQLGRLAEAEAWFKKAILIDERSVQVSGIDDPDLKPLWDSLGTPS